jgi:hypothetical protein
MFNYQLGSAVQRCPVSLSHRDLLLRRLVGWINDRAGIAGRHLPFLRLLLECQPLRARNTNWLKTTLSRTGTNAIADQVVRDFLRRYYERLTS